MSMVTIYAIMKIVKVVTDQQLIVCWEAFEWKIM